MPLQCKLKVLADPIRAEILCMLKNGRMSAGEIYKYFPVTAASVSRHLAVLNAANLVRKTRQGNHIFYQLNKSSLDEIIGCIQGAPLIIIRIRLLPIHYCRVDMC